MADSGRRCGSLPGVDGQVRWRVWAPFAQRVDLVLWDGPRRQVLAMGQEANGFYGHTQRTSEDQRYTYRLNGADADRPDPCSLWQPEGVAGPSCLFQPGKFLWGDQSWKGVSQEDMVFYELHVGTFTPEGTFDAIIPRLDSLRELGITAVELMPVGQFPGSRNWGYDGVLPYAAQNTYGGPQGLQRLVNAAHVAGIAVFLDVVYNHVGPESNYLQEFGPYFTDKYKTPWGQAINYDDRGCDPVRDWVLDNVRMWLEEFHLDGLRLDAIHAIYDLGAKHILAAIEEVAVDASHRSSRSVHIIGESDLNDPRVLYSRARGGYALDGQWSDDFHHAVHAFLTGERRGYFADYGSAEQLAETLNSPFLSPWEYSSQRGRKHGAAPDRLSGDRFVVCIQNHDQVGNRAKGDRLGTLLGSPAKQRLAACLMLFAPYLPLLFMGEEYGETNPFPFFCSFAGPELMDAVREGRRREFADFVSDPREVPDPGSKETFEAARLTWSWPAGSDQAHLRNLYRDLLTARKRWPALRDFSRRKASLLPTEGGGVVLQLVRGDTSAEAEGAVTLLFNLTDRSLTAPEVKQGVTRLFSSEANGYGGARVDREVAGKILPHECLAFGRQIETGE